MTGDDRSDIVTRSMQTLHIADLAEFEALEADWNAMTGAREIPFLRYQWVRAAYDTLHRQDNCHIVVVRDRDGLLAVAPMVRERRSRLYRLVGGAPLGEWGSCAIETPNAIAPLLNALSTLPGGIILQRISCPHLTQQRFADAAQPGAYTFWRPAPAAHFLPLAGSWTAFHAGLSSSRRKQLRRKWRQAEKIGDPVFRIVTPDRKSFAQAFNEFVALEDASWKGESGVSLRQAKPIGAFFRAIAEAFSAEGALRFFFLDVDGRPAAGQMTLVHGDRLWALKIGYDQAFRRFSPGLLLDQRVLEHCFQEGIGKYEFLGTADAPERFWSPKLRQFSNCHIYPKNLAGLAGFARSTCISTYRRANKLFRRA